MKVIIQNLISKISFQKLNKLKIIFSSDLILRNRHATIKTEKLSCSTYMYNLF